MCAEMDLIDSWENVDWDESDFWKVADANENVALLYFPKREHITFTCTRTGERLQEPLPAWLKTSGLEVTELIEDAYDELHKEAITNNKKEASPRSQTSSPAHPEPKPVNMVATVIDTIINIAKRPFYYLDLLQAKLGKWGKDMQLHYLVRKLSRFGEILTNRTLTVTVLGISTLKLTQLRNAIQKILTFLKKHSEKVPVLKQVIAFLEKIVNTVLWTVDTFTSMLESIGKWILEKVMDIIAPIIAWFYPDDDTESVETSKCDGMVLDVGSQK